MGGSQTPSASVPQAGIVAPKATLPDASPTVMQATLPTAADYAVNKIAVPEVGSMRDARQNYAANLLENKQLYGQPEKERNAQLIAQLAQNGISGAADAFSKALESQRQASGASQWASLQDRSSMAAPPQNMPSYSMMENSNKGSGNSFNFQPDGLHGYQLADDNRQAIDMAREEGNYMVNKARIDGSASAAAARSQMNAAIVNAIANIASSGISAYGKRSLS